MCKYYFLLMSLSFIKEIFFLISQDIDSPASITKASKLVESKLQDKGLNLIINNAGVNIPGSLQDTEKSTMVDVYATNVVGPMLVAKVGALSKTPITFFRSCSCFKM